MANPVIHDKFATHDLLSYALKEPREHLSAITTDLLQQGNERLAQDSLLSTAAAEIIAAEFFDFVVQYALVDAMKDVQGKLKTEMLKSIKKEQY